MQFENSFELHQLSNRYTQCNQRSIMINNLKVLIMSNSYIICFNTCGSDSICYVDGRKSIDTVHDHAMKHYNAMKKLKGSYSYKYGIGKGVKPSQVNEKQFTIAEY